MKLIVHVLLSGDMKYLYDFDKDSLPNVGDNFGEKYVVSEKQIKNNICELTLSRKFL